MKKITLLLVLLVAIVACNGNRQVRQGDVFSIEDVNKFIQNVSKDTGSFTQDQWVKLEKEYQDLLDKANKANKSLSEENREALEKLKNAFEMKKEEEIKQFKEYQKDVQRVIEEAKDQVDGDVKNKVNDAERAIKQGVEEVNKQSK